MGESSIKSGPFANFTPRAQRALALAHEEAVLFNQNFVGTEHLLLGLVKLGQGAGVTVLAKLGFDLETVRGQLNRQNGPTVIGNIPWTPHVKKVLQLAVEEARRLNHAYVGTEHILLALLQESGGKAGQVFKNRGIDAGQLHHAILKELAPNKPGLGSAATA